MFSKKKTGLSVFGYNGGILWIKRKNVQRQIARAV